MISHSCNISENRWITYVAHMLDEAFHDENSTIIDNPSESSIESYIEDLKNAQRSIPIKPGDKKSQNFKSSAEFALGDLIGQYDDRSEGFGIAFVVDAFDNEAVAGTTYIDLGNGIGCGTALVSLAKGCGKQLLKHMEKKFPKGFVCCPISPEVSKYYKSILKFDDIKKDQFIITSNANDHVKKVFADLGPRIEGLSNNDIKELKNKLKEVQ